MTTWSVTIESYEAKDRTTDLRKIVTIKNPNGTIIFTKTTPFTEYLTQNGWYSIIVEDSSGDFDYWEGPNGWTTTKTTFEHNPTRNDVFKIIFKKTSTPKGTAQIPTRFQLKIGITVFGNPTYFDLNEAISEFQNFVQANSKLNLQITLEKYPPLAIDEYHPISGSENKFVDPWYVHPETLAKLPPNVAVQIAIFDVQNTTPPYGGAAYHPSQQTRNVPFIGIAFGESIKWWPIESNWKTRTATALVHEFYHALSFILEAKGFTLPNPDSANSYGYTSENDPGWVRFDKFIYDQITDEMYLALTR